jgi:sugar O-acyltransferase (sialic acid O-acetyltransferase NeuD family)
MPTEATIAIVGSGGHASVVCDAFDANGSSVSQLQVFDDAQIAAGRDLVGYLVVAPTPGDVIGAGTRYHLAVGDNVARSALALRMQQLGGQPVTICHPRAVIAASARIAEGSFLAAGAVVGPRAVIDEHSIINHMAVVDHDCRVERCAHIAPGAVLGGGVRVGTGALVGAGATVLPGICVGAWSVVGAGAVVTHDVPDKVTVIGVPATVVKQHA